MLLLPAPLSLSPAPPWGWEALKQGQWHRKRGSPTAEQLVRFNWLKRASAEMSSWSCLGCHRPCIIPGVGCRVTPHRRGYGHREVQWGRSGQSHHLAKSGRGAGSCFHPLLPLRPGTWLILTASASGPVRPALSPGYTGPWEGGSGSCCSSLSRAGGHRQEAHTP